MQVLLFVFSLIFFAIIAYGYFNLFLRSGIFLALVAAAVVAVFAWYLARIVGTGGGIRKNPVLFAMLLIVSAAGVYNSLMLYLEGDRILTDAATEAQGQFASLRGSAEQGLASTGATARANQIRTTSEALFSEIRNPLNCGQGQEARRLIAELQRLLPGFTPLSNTGQRCERNEEVIKDYRERIDTLLGRAEWNNPDLSNVVSESNAAEQKLGELRSELSGSYSPLLLPRVLSEFETQDSRYRNLRQRLSRHADVRELSDSLHITEVQSLGNAFKLPALFLERIDQPVTWVYLLIAFGFDYFMVHCFMMVAGASGRRRRAQSSLAGAL
jgi:hypothetical protein